MKYIFLGLIVALLMVYILSPRAQQLAKSVWLITQTSPYEQPGTGAGLIVVVGDSTAYGTGVTDPKESIAGRIGSDFPTYKVTTLAKNGRVIGEVPGALQAAKLSPEIDVLLLQIGGNDILQGRTPEQIEADTRTMLVDAKQYAKQVVFMSCGNVGTAAVYVKNGEPDLLRTEDTLQAREIFIRVAAEFDVMYVDLYVPSERDVFLQQPGVYFASDGLHPSGAGYQIWYKNLFPVLNELLSS